MKNRLQKERKFWDSFAKKYDKQNKKNAHEAYNTLYRKFSEDIAGAKNLLEVATGTGLISLQLSNLVPSITAIDLSPEMLKIAKGKAKNQSIRNIDFKTGDICNLSFPDNSYDVIIASNVLHLLFEPEKAMLEMKRVIKTKGTVIVPTYCHGETLLSRFFSGIMSASGFRTRSRWSISSFQKFVTQNGFEITKQKTLKGLIPMIYLVAKQKP